jgi:branched-chain amino acid transport system permease protein
MADVMTCSHSNPSSIFDHPVHWRWAVPALLALVAFPSLAVATGGDFYITLASRILIFALAATSLNLILGFGGLVSFGHAAFIGIGAYTVAIAMQDGVVSAWVAWPLAMAVSALFALVIGAISLRTQGVYFIMITLAFAQMLYFLVVSLKAYGGDDGLAMAGRSLIGPGVDLAKDSDFYYVTLGLVALSIAGMARLLNARFGHTLQAIRENEVRMTAIGFPVYRFKLVAFTLAGALAGLAGALMANLGGFVSPALMQWSQSGMLMIMVILGGVGYLYGGLLGATFFLLLEELLSHYTIHWQLGLGAVLLLVVLLAPNGLASLLKRKKGASHG